MKFPFFVNLPLGEVRDQEPLHATQVPGEESNKPAIKEMNRVQEKEKATSPRQLLLGFFFGMIFGFLLQKGGVAKYEVLLGALLLTDLTVMKIMLTAIAVGMAGIFSLRKMGLVQLHVKPTRFPANIVGGLIFGGGFALTGYCPGTGAAALGQGNYDAFVGIAGMVAGSYLYAESSSYLASTILMTRGIRGKIMLPDFLGMRLLPFIGCFIPLIGIVLFGIEMFAP